MKNGLFVLLLFLSIQCLSQIPTVNINGYSDTTILLQRTKEIMKILNIYMRRSLDKDGSIRFIPDNYFDFFQAIFKPDTILYPGDSTHFWERYYPSSSIRLSSYADSVFALKIGIREGNYIKLQAMLVHEYTHFLQASVAWDYKSGFDAKTEKDFKDYVSQVNELEAFATEAYFFIENINPFLKQYGKEINLQNILISNNNQRRKFELLINAFRKYYQVNGSPVFNE